MLLSVSINSTSEEVRSFNNIESGYVNTVGGFPLIQLPRKSEGLYSGKLWDKAYTFPLIQLPRKSEVF